MKRLVPWLWLLASVLVFWTVADSFASNVYVGTYSKGKPGDVQYCQALLAGIVPLGEDPTGPEKNAAYQDLIDPAGSTTVFWYDDTTVPADLCTGVNVCPTWAVATCGQKNLWAINIRVPRDGDGNPLWCRADCSATGQPGDKTDWLFGECP